ncbi:MAG: hypothetical protein WBR17_22545, partial [Paraburkholderia sp.]|uniref:hypothetical protein n=1 Tax=Paraburkholderia sp. TaxID=1926495 RepID=UPI003C4F0BC6
MLDLSACAALVSVCLWRWPFLDLSARRLFLFAYGVGLSLICLRGAYFLCAFGVGLSLICYWSIRVAPVRGGTYFSLPAAKKSNRIGSQAVNRRSRWKLSAVG